MRRLAAKRGEVGDERVQKLDQLLTSRVGDDILVVFAEGAEAALPDFLSETGLHQRQLAFPEVDAACAVRQLANLFEFATGERGFISGRIFQVAPPRPK